MTPDYRISPSIYKSSRYSTATRSLPTVEKIYSRTFPSAPPTASHSPSGDQHGAKLPLIFVSYSSNKLPSVSKRRVPPPFDTAIRSSVGRRRYHSVRFHQGVQTRRLSSSQSPTTDSRFPRGRPTRGNCSHHHRFQLRLHRVRLGGLQTLPHRATR